MPPSAGSNATDLNSVEIEILARAAEVFQVDRELTIGHLDAERAGTCSPAEAERVPATLPSSETLRLSETASSSPIVIVTS